MYCNPPFPLKVSSSIYKCHICLKIQFNAIPSYYVYLLLLILMLIISFCLTDIYLTDRLTMQWRCNSLEFLLTMPKINGKEGIVFTIISFFSYSNILATWKLRLFRSAQYSEVTGAATLATLPVPYQQAWTFNFRAFYRARREYWENLVPATGRPYSSAFSSPQPHFDLIPGHEDFRQQKEMTTEEEVKNLAARKGF